MTREEAVIRALLSRSDVEAAAHALARNPEAPWAGLRAYIDKYWPVFAGTEADYARTYAVAGEHEAQHGAGPEILNQDARFTAVLHTVAAWGRLDGPLLDYGCGRGYYAVALHNATGCEVLGYDIDVRSVEGATEHAQAAARDPSVLRFAVGTHEHLRTDAPVCGAALVAEVLEHVRDYVAVIDAVEACLPDGAPVCVTVPYGPLEYNSWLCNPGKPREHLREFTRADLHEVFGAKLDVQMHGLKVATHPIIGDDGGIQIVTYRRDARRPTGTRNLDRVVDECVPKPVALPF